MKLSSYVLILSSTCLVTSHAREFLVDSGTFIAESNDDTIFNINLQSHQHSKLNKRHDPSSSSSSSICSFWHEASALALRISEKASQIFNNVYEEVEVMWTTPASETNNDKQTSNSDSVSYHHPPLNIPDDITNNKNQIVFKNDKHLTNNIDSDIDNDNDDNDYEGEYPQSGPTLLYTKINTIPEISYFAKYLRNSKVYRKRFNSTDHFTIIFAPTNQAIQSLNKKPWEFPKNIKKIEKEMAHHKKSNHKTEKKLEKLMNCNINSFVNAHIITDVTSVMDLGQLFDMKDHATAVLAAVPSIDSNESPIYIHTVDTNGNSHLAKTTSQHTTKNGVIFIIDNPLTNP